MTLLYPADFAGERFQKLTLPVDGPDSGQWADEITPPRLDTYSSQYARLASDKTLLMSTWFGGATTSGSKNPRSEWRETNPDGSLAGWNGLRGTHRLYLPGLSINQLTPVRPIAVLAQIHNGANDVTVLRAEGVKRDGELTDDINLWLTRGNTSHAKHVAKIVRTQRFSFGFHVHDGVIAFHYNGVYVPKFLVSASDDSFFKWGLYLQANRETAPGESAKSYAQARFFVPPMVSHAR